MKHPQFKCNGCGRKTEFLWLDQWDTPDGFKVYQCMDCGCVGVKNIAEAVEVPDSDISRCDKILVLEPYLDLLGGSERMAFEAAKGLAKEGWEVHVGYQRDGIWRERYRAFVKGFHQIRLPVLTFRRPWELIATAWRLRRLMRKLGIRAIFTSYNGHLLAAALLERFGGVRSCFHLGLMGSVANTVPGRWAVRQISAGVAPSEQTAESWREIGWPKETMHVVPNWIDWA